MAVLKCTLDQQVNHTKAMHTATCRVCGAEKYYPAWDVALRETDESPYKRAFRVFNCGDEVRHSEIRAMAQALPGDPKGDGRHSVVDSMKKDELRILGKLPFSNDERDRVGPA